MPSNVLLSMLATLSLTGTPAEPPRTLPAAPPAEVRVEYRSYWGNPRKAGSGGAIDLSFSEEGCRYKTERTDPTEFSFAISHEDFLAAYAFVRDHKLDTLKVEEQMVHDSFGDSEVRVVAPVDIMEPKTLDLDVHANANSVIADPRWKEVVDHLLALGKAAKARADTEGISHFTLVKDPSLGHRSAYAYFVGHRGSLDNVPVLPGTYKLRVGVWPEGMTKYDASKLTFVERTVEIPKVKQLTIKATASGVELVEAK
jgi:hypothetical protein